MPTKGSRMAACYDLDTITDFTIATGGHVLVETGIPVRLPKGTYTRLALRSGLASRNGINIRGGVIDVEYTGQVKIIMINLVENVN